MVAVNIRWKLDEIDESCNTFRLCTGWIVITWPKFFFSMESLYEIIDENGNAQHDCD